MKNKINGTFKINNKPQKKRNFLGSNTYSYKKMKTFEKLITFVLRSFQYCVKMYQKKFQRSYCQIITKTRCFKICTC